MTGLEYLHRAQRRLLVQVQPIAVWTLEMLAPWDDCQGQKPPCSRAALSLGDKLCALWRAQKTGSPRNLTLGFALLDVGFVFI